MVVDEQVLDLKQQAALFLSLVIFSVSPPFIIITFN